MKVRLDLELTKCLLFKLGRLREGKPTYAFFLVVRKPYDTVWHNGL